MTTPESRAAPWVGRVILGLLLVAGGVVWLLDSLGYRIPWGSVLPVGLILVGVALVADARRGSHGGLIALGAILTVILALGVTARPVFEVTTVTGGVGERIAEPISFETLEDAYQLGMGSLRVDLSDVDFPEGTTTVEVNVGVGEAMVIVPADVTVVFDGRVAIGDMSVLGEQRDGVGPSITRTFPGDDPGKVLALNAKVGVGELVVRR